MVEKKTEYKVPGSAGGFHRVAYWRERWILNPKPASGMSSVGLAEWLTSLEAEGRVTDVVPVDTGTITYVLARVEAYVPEGEDRQ